jgi:hypothetical protein
MSSDGVELDAVALRQLAAIALDAADEFGKSREPIAQ